MKIFINALSIALVTVLFVAHVRAGDKVNKKDAAARTQALALFQKALAVSDIRAPGSPPFELQGTIDIHEAKGKDSRGSYDLKWAAPDKWREEIRLGDASQIRVGGKDQFWQTRSPNLDFAAAFQVAHTLGFLQIVRYYAKPAWMHHVREVKIRGRKIGGVSATCATLVSRQANSGPEYCFDVAKGFLVGSGGKAAAYSQFMAFGGKLFPGRIVSRGYLNQTVEFSGASFTALQNPDPAQFQQRPDSEAVQWCESPDSLARIIRQVRPVYPPVARESSVQGTVWFYAVIGADGRVHNLRQIGSPNPELANAAAAAMEQWEYEPESCGGRPVPVETMLEAIFNLD